MKAKNKGQIWHIDFLLALVVVSVVLFAVFQFSGVFATTTPYSKAMISEAYFLSEQLLQQGQPADWTDGTIEKIGLLSNKTLDEQKIQAFYEFDQSQLDAYLPSSYSYWIRFVENDVPVEFNGISFVGEQPINATTQFSVTRLAFLDAHVIQLQVIVWQ
ncbi:MAG: hypothetical protein ACMXYF_00810 [Candidatus Woesearchaeota archaeon]